MTTSTEKSEVTSTPEAAAIGRSAGAWLTSLPDRLPGQGGLTVRALCHVLVAAWVADRMTGTDQTRSSEYGELAQRVARSLNSQTDGGYEDGVKPTLKLLVEILLSAEGLRVKPFGEFFSQTVSILRRPEPDLVENRALMEKRVLLNCVGVDAGPIALSAAGLHGLLSNVDLAAPAAVVDTLTLELECLTGWGTRRAVCQVPSALGDIMAGFAVQHLRRYDLIPAARLMRLLEYLAASGVMDRRSDLYRGLGAHRRKHGPFGWYGPEAAELRRLASPTDHDPELRADVELYLPSTLECLWTLAEVSCNDWRLFEQLPDYVPERGR